MVDKGRYQRLVGKLIYLSHTWPYVAYAMSVVIKYMHKSHLEAVYHIFEGPKISSKKRTSISKTWPPKN